MKTRIIFLSMIVSLAASTGCKKATAPTPSANPPAKDQPAKEQPKQAPPKQDEPKAAPVAIQPPQPKAEKSLIEQILESHEKTEPARLKKLEGEFALLPKEKQDLIVAGRQALLDGSWGKWPGDEYRIFTTHIKFFHRGHIAWMRYTIGNYPECLEMIKVLGLTDPKQIITFQIQVGYGSHEMRRNLLDAIKEAARVGVSNTNDDYKDLLRPYAEFLGNLKK
jgi:hypothetical protein